MEKLNRSRSTESAGGGCRARFAPWWWSWFALLALLCTSLSYAMTPAGTLIRNQASASFTDASGQRHTVTSNIVETRIEQVASLVLDVDQQRQGLAGAAVVFTHRLVNTGNGDDRFDLSLLQLGGDSADFVSLAMHADANQDGLADDALPLVESPWLLPDEGFSFVVVAQLPSTLVPGDTLGVAVSATSRLSSAVSAGNTDVAVVVDGAVLDVVKSMSSQSGPAPGGPHTVGLTLSNRGSAAAQALTLIDALPPGMRYVAGSARLQADPQALTDTDPGDLQTAGGFPVRYCAYDPSCAGLPESLRDDDASSVNQVSLQVDSLPPGSELTLQFDVTIDAGVSGILTNQAELDTGDPLQRLYGNPVSFLAQGIGGVVLNGSVATPINGMSEPVVEVSAPQGGRVQFPFSVWNTGTVRDTVNLDVLVAASSFPPGSTYRLLAVDGATPLQDTNADGVEDTGPIDAGASRQVVLEVRLPAASAGNNGGVGYAVDVLGRSASRPVNHDSLSARLDEITGNRVDITNQAPAGDAAALGTGPGPEALPVSTLDADLGTAVFELYVRHQGLTADSYRLGVAGDPTGSALPTGWFVDFSDDTGNRGLTTTRVLASGEYQHIVATVTLPPGQGAGTQSLYFVAESARTGARDVKHDAVRVPASQRVRLEPSLSAQLEPGGTVVYQHRLVNAGNTPVGSLSFAITHVQPGWQSVLYEDTDADGRLGPADLVVSNLPSLAAGESRVLFLKVFAPANAALGLQDVATLSVQWTASSGSESRSVTDTSRVTRTNVSIRKQQAVDEGCDGAPDAIDGFVTDEISVAPGENCVIYRLEATNHGTEASYNVVIHDYTPPFTVYRPAAICSRTPCWVTEPASEETGVVVAETDQLAPGDSYYLQFSVRVQ